MYVVSSNIDFSMHSDQAAQVVGPECYPWGSKDGQVYPE